MSEKVKQIHRVMINAPIQQVWDTLTQDGVVQPFFFNSVLHTTSLAPGAPMRMRSKNGKYTGVVGDVLELEPPHLYVTSFKFTNYDDPVCIVRHELKEKDGGTEYTLISEQVPAGTKTAKQMDQGGVFITQTMKAVCETGKPSFGNRMILGIIGMTAFMAPKKSLSENWPLEMKFPVES